MVRFDSRFGRILAIVALVTMPVAATVACRTTTRPRPSDTNEAIRRGFRYDRIALTVRSADGLPIAGVPLAWNLSAWAPATDSGGTTQPIVVVPGWRERIVGGEVFGETNAAGIVRVGPVRATTNFGQRPSSISIFATATSRRACPGGGPPQSYYAIIGELTMTKRTPPGTATDTACSIDLAHSSDRARVLELECKASMTMEEIEAAAKEFSPCPPAPGDPVPTPSPTPTPSPQVSPP